jgi:hypothetical protein
MFDFDENMFIPQYELKSNLSQIDYDRFSSLVLPQLKQLFLSHLPLNRTSPYLEFEEGLEINQSITEWETRYALQLDALFSSSRCLWMNKNFDFTSSESIIDAPSSIDLCFHPRRFAALTDILEKDSTMKPHKLISLHQFMKEALPLSFKRITIQPISYLLQDEAFHQYLEEVHDYLMERFIKELDENKSKQMIWNEVNIGGFVLKKEDLFELIHHSRITYEKNDMFFGRQDLIDQTFTQLISGKSNSSGSPGNLIENELSGITLALIGKSGTGKTSLMAKLAMKCFEEAERGGAGKCKKEMLMISKFR